MQEIDQNGYLSGKRAVSASDHVIQVVDPPAYVHCLELNLGSSLSYVKNVSTNWFSHEEWVEYELVNKSRFCLAVEVGIVGISEEEYYAAWDIFRKAGIDRPADTLGDRVGVLVIR